jgi:hypothetical protein
MLLAGLALGSSAAPAQAQLPVAPTETGDPLAVAPGDLDAVTRPKSASRLVRVFDFEERRRNPTDLPMNWVRAQDDPQVPRNRPGFPIWNQGTLVYGSHAAAGQGAVRLHTRGGSTSLLLDPGVVGVFPGADYLVSAAIRTEALTHARAQIAARLLNDRGQAIPGTERTSPLMRTGGEWTPVAIEILGDAPDAAFIQIELLLLQPGIYERSDLPDPLHVEKQDLTGSAWFDEIRIVQLPRVEVWSDDPGNIAPGDQPPSFEFLVRDLTGEPLDIEMTLHDDRGMLVAERVIASDGGREEGTWAPAVPGFGWYRASVRVASRGVRIGRAFTDVVWIPAVTDTASSPDAASRLDPRLTEGSTARSGVNLETSADRSRFGVALSRLPVEALTGLSDAVDATQAGFVSIPAWDDTTTAEGIRERVDALSPVISAITTSVPLVELSLMDIPPTVRVEADVDRDDLVGLLTGPRTAWDDALRWPLDRFGGAVPRWRLGPAGSDLNWDRVTLGADLSAISAAISRLVPAPLLSVPWSADRSLRAEVVRPRRSVAVRLDPMLGGGMAKYIGERWREAAARTDPAVTADAPEMRLELPGTRSIDAPAVGRRAATALFVRTATEFWSAMAVPNAPLNTTDWGLTVADAWWWTGQRRPELMPAPETAALRVLADRLAGRRFVGRPNLVPGVETLLFDGPDGALLAMWRTGEAPPELRARLGLVDLLAFDMYGNAEPIPLSAGGNGLVPEHAVPISDEPVFVEGVDAQLITFLDGIALDPPLLQTRADEAAHDLVIKNPWGTSIRGRFFILEPGGGLAPPEEMARLRKSWRITPRQGNFAISGLAEQRTPIAFSFSPAEETGPRELVVDMELSGERDYGLVRVVRPIEVGLNEADLELTFRRGPGPGGPDLVVEAQVTNLGETPLTIELFARAPGYPRDRAAISNLPPGESATRVFPFRKGSADLAGAKVFVGAQIAETGGRLSRSIEIGRP